MAGIGPFRSNIAEQQAKPPDTASTPGNFMFYEIWDSEQDLEVHNNTELMKAFGDKAGGWLGSITVETYRRL